MLLTVVFDSRDDDGGNAQDDSVAGDNRRECRQGARGPGYWQTQYRPVRPRSAGATALLLAIVRHVSIVFSEETAPEHERAGVRRDDARRERRKRAEKLDRALLTAWLNFANGAFGYDELVDTDGAGAGHGLLSLMAAAEAVRVNPTSTEAELRAQRQILQRISGS